MVNGGVPQDSVLGPLLWNLRFDPVVPDEMRIVGYADDTMIIAGGTSWSRTARLMETAEIAVISIIRSGIKGFYAWTLGYIFLHFLQEWKRWPPISASFYLMSATLKLE